MDRGRRRLIWSTSAVAEVKRRIDRGHPDIVPQPVSSSVAGGAQGD
jgi:hypothetical protein